MIVIVGHLVVDEADRSTVVEAFRDLVRRARDFPGCVHLAITADPVDPRRVNNAEVWESAEALAAWRAQANAPDPGVEIVEDHMRKYEADDGGAVF
ncbi:putative quinol monooxygenase [Saccharopolyspora rosea]|uniref:Quinol monooxygenase n=1 Tax=Saccharopolyspora rosea TaxID=524884 RepID=A0ABW3FIN2_9PSEU|nr:antibiotic biosynthesis monooxygenase family protein [Saccharopolyspora rosea]